jgi:hypothetical protein
MKRIPTLTLVLAMVFTVAGPAAATTMLSFEGGGYCIDMEVGDDGTPTIASIRFHEPSDARGILLPPRDWRIASFDNRRQVLVLRHAGGHSRVEPFVLSVRHRDAVLAIGGRRITGPFRWEQ